MPQSSEVDIQVPSNEEAQPIEDMLNQKLMIEPSEFVSREAVVYVHTNRQQGNKPDDDDDQGENRPEREPPPEKKPGN
ncbi:MAG TPA: hypothetical protein VG759_18030 [Candidatus Angelobacter sp.]|jgi:hypothetical protein|nr:hypothetical protein [Candidatus Angelobacter sp.]